MSPAWEPTVIDRYYYAPCPACMRMCDGHRTPLVVGYPTPPQPQSPVLALGWECPRCRRIHAPHVSACGCVAPTYTSSGTAAIGWDR